MNSADKKKFHIQNIEITGDKRTSFIIKKKINRFSNNEGKNKINIFIELEKERKIQEKDIRNKVTKYKLSINANLKVSDIESKKELNRTFNSNQTYIVESNYSNTVNNLKEANNLLIETIVNEILDQLRIYYN
tara:strand:+ start:131 stop:529 length:399 start_codon:yes stop_codon:yes gene_type:complete